MRKLVKVIAGVLTTISVLSFSSIEGSADWRKDNVGWWNTEGASYSKGWRKIDGVWYYFYEDDNYGQMGYMAHDTIIDGYYLNNSGGWSNKPNEVQVYSNLLKDIRWQSNNGIRLREGKSTIDKNVILDIDQDGVMEMLLNNGTCSADEQVSVVTYDNGNVNVQHINTFSGGYLGYSKSSRVFFVNGGHMGNYYKDGYTIENKKCKKLFSSTDDEIYSKDSNECLVISGHNYTINGEKVSNKEYDNYFKSFGNIER